MAKTDAENQKAYRERQRKLIGEEEFKRLNHEAYLRRRERLERENPKATLYEYIRAFLENYEMRRRENGLSVADHQKIETDAHELFDLLISNRGNYSDCTIARRKSPIFDSDFFKAVCEILDEDEERVWDHVYAMLHIHNDYSTTWLGFRVQVGTTPEQTRHALQKLSSLDVISFEEHSKTHQQLQICPSEETPYIFLKYATVKLKLEHEITYVRISRGVLWEKQEESGR